MSIISAMEYRIDIMQETLFVLDSEDQLYDCINDLERFLNERLRYASFLGLSIA